MRSVNLFLTEDGVLKLGYYGLTTQAEYYSIKGMNCEGIRSFTYEMSKGGYEMKNDVWSLRIALMEMRGMRPCYWNNYRRLPRKNGGLKSPFKADDIQSSQLAHFLAKCFDESMSERCSVNELMDVSVMG